MESLVDKMKDYINQYYTPKYVIEEILPLKGSIDLVSQDIKEIAEHLYSEERGYTGPFIEQVAPGLYKIQTDHMKVYGGQGVIDEIEKILKEK